MEKQEQLKTYFLDKINLYKDYINERVKSGTKIVCNFTKLFKELEDKFSVSYNEVLNLCNRFIKEIINNENIAVMKNPATDLIVYIK